LPVFLAVHVCLIWCWILLVRYCLVLTRSLSLRDYEVCGTCLSDLVLDFACQNTMSLSSTKKKGRKRKKDPMEEYNKGLQAYEKACEDGLDAKKGEFLAFSGKGLVERATTEQALLDILEQKGLFGYFIVEHKINRIEKDPSRKNPGGLENYNKGLDFYENALEDGELSEFKAGEFLAFTEIGCVGQAETEQALLDFSKRQV